MRPPIVIVQASSRSWSGGDDLCINHVDGEPAVIRTIKRAISFFSDSRLIVTAPEFDQNGALSGLIETFFDNRVKIFFGHDDSPLQRMIAVTQNSDDDYYLIRVDGLHFCFDGDAAKNMLQQAMAGGFDVVKLPDDFPVQFGVDVYRIGALRCLGNILINEEDKIFHVHPKFYCFAHPELFSCSYLNDVPEYDIEFLLTCQKKASGIYAVPRLEVNKQRFWAGDQLSFHYEVASKYLTAQMKVLDIACGDGYGTRKLSSKVKEIWGGDIDVDSVKQARLLTTQANVSFFEEDITMMSFDDKSFDAVLSMETIEHVDDTACLAEIYRVLRPGGILILSTPQNRLGHLPINTAHIREYKIEQIKTLCSNYFNIIKVIGIKAGRIIIPDDPLGSNVILVCEKTDE